MAGVESYVMSDAPINVAIDVLCAFNQGKVRGVNHPILGLVVMTDVDPNELVYPEGWQYKDGCYCNKHDIATGLYEEVLVLKPTDKRWKQQIRHRIVSE